MTNDCETFRASVETEISHFISFDELSWGKNAKSALFPVNCYYLSSTPMRTAKTMSILQQMILEKAEM